MESTESINIDLQQVWLIIKRRWLPAAVVFSSVAGLAAVHTFLQKPVYEAEGKLLLKKIDANSSLTKSGEQIGELNSLTSGSNPLNTETEIIRSLPIVQGTIASLNLSDKQGDRLKPKAFLDQLKIKAVTGTDVLQVSYESTNPEEAAAVVNQLMNRYLESNAFTNQTEAVKAREFITRQLPKTEATVRRAESVLRKFKEENNIVALQEEAQSTVAAIKDLENQLTQTQSELGVTSAQSEVLRQKLGMNSQEAVASSSLSQSPAVQKALEELQQVQAQLAVLRTRYQEAHPIIVDLKQRESAQKTLLQGRVGQVIGSQKPEPNKNLQVAELKQNFTTNLVESEAGRLGLTRKVSTLSNKLATYQQRASTLPRLEQQQRQLERQLTAAQSTYETLLQKLQDIRVTENQVIGNARIVEAAVVPEDILLRPSALKLALAVLAGLLLGVATIVVLEVKDISIKTVKEARELFGYTLLGVIPAFNKSVNINPRDSGSEQLVEVIVRDIPRSPISETYRMLQANLKFLSSDKPPKVIVVTSSVPQEGKSTLSANLAAAIAKPGRRVLLVDADMRRPRQHQIWNLLNEVGLSNVLVGEAEPKMALKKVMNNLDVLTAGVTPPNPVDLLDSNHMTTLIESFSDSYDFVVIDTPAANVAADAAILGKMSDGVLLVVRPGVVDTIAATAAKELLEGSGQKLLGLVANGVMPNNEPYSYYHYAREYYAEEDSITPVKAGSRR